jgi:hypothetical protein
MIYSFYCWVILRENTSITITCLGLAAAAALDRFHVRMVLRMPELIDVSCPRRISMHKQAGMNM